MSERVLISWSGGKDSCMALEELLTGGRFQVAALLTTLTRESDCISMHGVRRELLERQSESLGLHLERVIIPRNASRQPQKTRLGRSMRSRR